VSLIAANVIYPNNNVAHLLWNAFVIRYFPNVW